jgi:hypothetical protein
MSQNKPLRNSSGQRRVAARRQQRLLLVAALALTGLGLRLSVTSVGSVLGNILWGSEQISSGLCRGGTMWSGRWRVLSRVRLYWLVIRELARARY